MKRLVLAVLFLLSACYSVPTVTTTDTTGQQSEARQAADMLSRSPLPAGAIERAQDALNQCSVTLAVKDRETRTCAAHLSECGQQFETQAEKLRACQVETGFLSVMSLRLRWFAIGFGAAVVAGIALYFSGALVQIAAKVR